MISAALNEFVKEHENDDIRVLALRATQFAEIDIQLAIRQITGRRIAKEKIPSTGRPQNRPQPWGAGGAAWQIALRAGQRAQPAQIRTALESSIVPQQIWRGTI